ncbi:MAG: hypothetical protein WCS69_13495 [Ignavibacteriaceae bacterium]|jgi:DNA-directed RNA polymerase subunit RPC12/RpoP
MKTILFILLAVILGGLAAFFTLHEKKKCPNCQSKNITKTGKKIYEEETSIAVTSPTSYQKLEYKCDKCGHLFYIKQRALLFE